MSSRLHWFARVAKGEPDAPGGLSPPPPSVSSGQLPLRSWRVVQDVEAGGESPRRPTPEAVAPAEADARIQDYGSI